MTILKNYRRTVLLAAMLVMPVAACDSGFTGGDKKSANSKFVPVGAKGGPTLPLVASLVCEPGETSSQISGVNIDFKDETRRVEVTGQFCPSAPSRLNVVFLLDVSYSLTTPNKPNDPLVGDTCGRLDAVKAVIDRYQQTVDKDTADVRVAVIPFARNVEKVTELTDITKIDSKLTSDYFCQGVQGGTNYKAVFNRTEEMFKDEFGKTVAYFITDGMPTFGGGGNNDFRKEHRDAAESAMKALKKAMGKKLILNTLFLGNIYDEVAEEENIDFEKYLVDLTGDKDRFKIATKAKDLVSEILDLKPEAAEIESDTAKASARYGGNEVDIEFQEFVKHPSKDLTWAFKTEALELVNKDKERLEAVILTAKDADGEEFKVKIEVKDAASGGTPAASDDSKDDGEDDNDASEEPTEDSE